MIQKFSKGDIFYYNFGSMNCVSDHIERKLRPVLIISNNLNNTFSTNVNIVPITTRSKEKCKEWQVYFNNNGRDQVILCEQIFTVSSDNLQSFIGRIDEITLKEVDKALAIQLNLNTIERELNSLEFIKRLDTSIENILKNKLKVENKNFSAFMHSMDDLKKNQEKQKCEIDTLINNKLSFLKDNMMKDIIELKEYFKTNSNELNLILTSLIGLYENIGENENDLSNKGIETIFNNVNNEKIVDKSKKTKDHKEKIQIENITEHKQLTEYQMLVSYNIQDCLDFLKEYQNNSVDKLCEVYNCSKKKLYNRKYAVKKYLDSHNVNYTDVDCRKGINKKQ